MLMLAVIIIVIALFFVIGLRNQTIERKRKINAKSIAMGYGKLFDDVDK